LRVDTVVCVNIWMVPKKYRPSEILHLVRDIFGTSDITVDSRRLFLSPVVPFYLLPPGNNCHTHHWQVNHIFSPFS
jgi:hypothetical protein